MKCAQGLKRLVKIWIYQWFSKRIRDWWFYEVFSSENVLAYNVFQAAIVLTESTHGWNTYTKKKQQTNKQNKQTNQKAPKHSIYDMNLKSRELTGSILVSIQNLKSFSITNYSVFNCFSIRMTSIKLKTNHIIINMNSTSYKLKFKELMLQYT